MDKAIQLFTAQNYMLLLYKFNISSLVKGTGLTSIGPFIVVKALSIIFFKAIFLNSKVLERYIEFYLFQKFLNCFYTF